MRIVSSVKILNAFLLLVAGTRAQERQNLDPLF